MTRSEERIAIVGIGGLFPGAGDLDAFWANVKAARDGSSDPPPGRWALPPEHVLHPDAVLPDKVPTLRGYYLPPFTADLTGMDLAGWPLAELDPVFHLALHIANVAWNGVRTEPLDRERCGVVLGNIALPTEKANAITLEVMGPKLGLFHPTTRTDRRNLHSTGLPAALVARGLGFGLGGFALDAACASSLYAIKLACDELLAGRADAMIAGGLCRPDSLYTQMGFAQLRALSPTGRCSPFDARADGLLVGEGGCAFVLKRLSDALAHGDTIHGVIAGIGLSNDIEGNVLQPATEGQLRALRAAYKQAGWRPADVQLIECHATGTPTGDAVEFASLCKLWEGEPGRAVLGGVKSTVGHLLTGAGAAALAKVLLAFREKTFPPTANFERPNPRFGYESSPFRVLRRSEPWEAKGPRRAAVNGFGFGGINAHLLIEEWTQSSPLAPRADRPRSASSGQVGDTNAVSARGASGLPCAEPIAIVGIASRSGSPIESLNVPATRFRIPPTELAEMLPQQTLMLQVAAEALDDTRSHPADGLTTGVYVGVALDPNTTNYHLRWLAGEIDPSLKDQVHPALTANRTMGSLASIAASRVARFLGAGGPSFAVCDEDAGALRAVSLAVNALRNGEIDRALVGGVEFASDPRSGWGADGAAAVVLKRLSDARRDGDRTYLVIRDVRSQHDSTPDGPHWDLAFPLCTLVDTCQKVVCGLGHDDQTFLLRDLADGPFSMDLSAWHGGGYSMELEAADHSDRIASTRPTAPALASQSDGLFTLTRNTPAEAPTGPTITLPVGYHPKPVQRSAVEASPSGRGIGFQPVPSNSSEPEPVPVIVNAPIGQVGNLSHRPIPAVVLAETQTATGQAHEAYLRFASALQGQFAQAIAWQTAVLQEAPGNSVPAPIAPPAPVTRQSRPGDGIPRSLDLDQCFEFARGLVGNVFGPKFAAIDTHPTRVRLPDGPLQLVDRVVTIEGEPLSLTSGRLVTDHRVHADRWYLEHARIPACISIEAGQADLMLSGFLGIDFKTRGLACYRLLDAAVTFHRDLPKVGDQLRYDIRIDHFFRQGDTYLFRFRFEGTVNGEPLLTMRDGCAGFFTADELAAGKGIVHTALDLKPVSGKKPDGWAPHVPLRNETLTDTQVDALRAGDLVAAFGPDFGRAKLTNPMRLPGGMLNLVHRVERIEPVGGRYGLGRIRCEADIHPDDWFLTCHFVDDQVMPGTLMYECCLHTMRVLLMRMGWVSEDSEARFEPVPGVASRLKCRGQVIATTKKVTYEVSLKEIGFRPEPYAIGDALMYADGKPIVEVKDISLRMSGMTRERLDEIWAGNRAPVFVRDQVLEFATGSPSKAFGDRYRPFDRDRFIARLPGNPYSFIDRVARFENGQPWKLAAGATAQVEYDVPRDAWYFAANRCEFMPYSVLNEVALQACGWMAAYLGAALASPDDLHFRNLGGNATQHAALRPDAGTLVTHVKLTKVSPAAGMIILQFDFAVSNGAGPIYSGDTTFGFFTKSSLANQVGLKDARFQPRPGGEMWSGPVSTDPPFPDSTLRMVDRIEWATTTGGPKGLGMVEGRARVNPEAWFFEAHFFGDPVWPGSLGLESLVQLMKVWAHRRWGDPPAGWQAMAPGTSHKWAYRGQIVPTATEVTIQAYITQVDDVRKFLKADGLLGVDGRIIYQMSDFTLRG